jgi:UDP-2,4-diacetamido-2,4,6-trideoxy-beta-L-altropyranose hydrolase
MQLLIRADASTGIGAGHVMRCLALAQAWQSVGGQVELAAAAITPALKARVIAEGIEFVSIKALAGSAADMSETTELARRKQVDLVVIDGYQFDAHYQQGLKSAGRQVLCIDDYGHANYYAVDWVLNQNLYAPKIDYCWRADYTRLLLGTDYALLRREFWGRQAGQRATAPVAGRVLVTLGGSDPANVTLKVVQALGQVEQVDL